MKYLPFTYKLITQSYSETVDGTLPDGYRMIPHINTEIERAIIITVSTEIQFCSLEGVQRISKMVQKFEIPNGIDEGLNFLTRIPEIVYRAYATHVGWICAKENIIMNNIPSLYEISKYLDYTPLV